MAKAQPEKVGFWGRIKQIGMVIGFTAKNDKRFIPFVVGLAVGWIVVAALVVWLVDSWLGVPIALVGFLLTSLILLNLRANTAMMAQAEGQPGAAAGVLQTLRGDWRVTPAVQITTQQDFVHRAVSRTGVVLVAEGNPKRIRGLLAQEKKRLGKVVGDTPIYDVIVGDDEGQVPLRKLRVHIAKLPRNIDAKQLNSLDSRLSALGGVRPAMPKGPIPKGAKLPKGAMRGR